MCEFKSFIVTESGAVLYNNQDSHESIIRQFADKYDLRDETTDPERLLFARVEITPPDRDVFEKDLSKWNFKIDQSITPAWWSEENKRECFAALEKYLGEVIIDGQGIDTIENKSGLYIRNSKIGILKNTQVNEMRESSQVNEMWGSSQVNVMRESSRVNEMWESSRVNEMWGSSQVNEMWGSSQVNEMRESSQVNEMWGSSRVNEMWGSSQVNEMRGSSQVNMMRESSRVNLMRESSQVNVMRGSSQVNVMRESSRVNEMWGSSQVNEMWGSSQVRTFSPKVSYKLNGNAIAIERYTGTPIIKVANPEIVLEIIKEAKK